MNFTLPCILLVLPFWCRVLYYARVFRGHFSSSPPPNCWDVFGSWQVLCKTPFDTAIFLPPQFFLSFSYSVFSHLSLTLPPVLFSLFPAFPFGLSGLHFSFVPFPLSNRGQRENFSKCYGSSDASPWPPTVSPRSQSRSSQINFLILERVPPSFLFFFYLCPPRHRTEIFSSLVLPCNVSYDGFFSCF